MKKRFIKQIGSWITAPIRRCRQELEGLSPAKKLEHLWTYYKGVLLAAVIVAVLISVIATGIRNANKEILICGTVTNVSLSQEGYDYLSLDYADLLDADPEKQLVELHYAYFEGQTSVTRLDENYAAKMTAVAMASAERLDYLILDERALEAYIPYGMFLDLRDFFTPEEMEQWKSSVIYAQPDEQEMFPVAIDITQIPFVRENIHSEGPIYLAFAGNTRRLEACRHLWTYLQAWEKAKS